MITVCIYFSYFYFLLIKEVEIAYGKKGTWQFNVSVDFLSRFSFENLSQQRKVKIGNSLQMFFFQELKQ